MRGVLLNRITKDWGKLVSKAKGMEAITYGEIFEVYRETFKVFSLLSKEEFLPREASQALMLADEFTYYATMIDENYFSEISSGLFYLNYALKNEFFRGEYRSEFFFGEVPERIEEFVSGMEGISKEDFIRFLKGEMWEGENRD